MNNPDHVTHFSVSESVDPEDLSKALENLGLSPTCFKTFSPPLSFIISRVSPFLFGIRQNVLNSDKSEITKHYLGEMNRLSSS